MNTAELKVDLSKELENVNTNIAASRAQISTEREAVRDLLEERKGIERLLNAIDRKPRTSKKDS